jgi:hypothetical protein
MASSSKKTWVVREFGSSEEFEVSGSNLITDDNNTNRVTVMNGDEVVAQLNSVESIRPKS